jgi:DNA-binding MarR family transcriptional regulator
MQLAEDVDVHLASVLESLVRVVRRLASAGDLSLPAAAVLARVVAEGPQRLTDLAASERISQPGTTQLVTRLERDGLVQRAPSADDRRVVLVAATDAGRELVRRRRAQRADALRDLLDRLDPDDRQAVRDALPALARLVELAAPSRPAGGPA